MHSVLYNSPVFFLAVEKLTVGPPPPQSLQEEPTSTSSQLTELMMAAQTTLTSQLPRDLPPDAPRSSGNFLINLEGELTIRWRC